MRVASDCILLGKQNVGWIEKKVRWFTLFIVAFIDLFLSPLECSDM